MSGHVVYLENRPETIQEQLRITTKYHLEHDICQRPQALGDLLEGDTLKGKGIKAFVFDMHDNEVLNLAEINLPNVDTSKGEAVGLAVAEKYIKPKIRFRGIPIVFLTAYKIHAPAKRRIELLRQRSHDDIVDINKDDLQTFDDFIRKLVGPNTHIRRRDTIDLRRPEPRPESARLQDYVEAFDVASKILAEFKLPDVAIAALFGKVIKTNNQWGNIAHEIRRSTHLDMDIHDRSELIIDIKVRLESIFGVENVALQQKWLETGQADLAGRSPLALLKSAHQHELAHVAAILRQITG